MIWIDDRSYISANNEVIFVGRHLGDDYRGFREDAQPETLRVTSCHLLRPNLWAGHFTCQSNVLHSSTGCSWDLMSIQFIWNSLALKFMRYRRNVKWTYWQNLGFDCCQGVARQARCYQCGWEYRWKLRDVCVCVCPDTDYSSGELFQLLSAAGCLMVDPCRVCKPSHVIYLFYLCFLQYWETDSLIHLEGFWVGAESLVWEVHLV